jgi:uncharacterized protein DUF3352
MSDNLPPEDPGPTDGFPPSDLPPMPGPEPIVTAVTEAGPAPEPPRRRGAVLALVLAIVLVVIAAGGALAYLKMRGGPGAVLDKLPAGADVAFIAHLDPAAGQKANLFRLTEKFPDLGSREQLTQRFNDMVDEALAGSGLSHEDLSWIGGEAGGYVDVRVGAPEYALVLAVDDEGAARAALQQIRDQQSSSTGEAGSTMTISGVEVWTGSDGSSAAVFDDVAVVASDENAMRSVIDTANGASSIQDDAEFQDVMNRLPQDNLGFVFVNMHELVSMLGAIPAGVIDMPSMSMLEGLEGLGYAVTAEPDGLAIDAVATTDPSKLPLDSGDEPTSLLGDVPADAFAVFGSRGDTAGGPTSRMIQANVNQIAALDPAAARLIQRLHLDEFFGHLTGDSVVQLGPGSLPLPVSGTVILGIDDPGAVSSWLDRYMPMLLAKSGITGSGGNLTERDHDGVTITSVGGFPPMQFSWAVTDDALITGISAADVAEAIDLSNGTGDAITSDPGYIAATDEVPGTSVVAYVDLPAILAAVKGFLPADEYQAFLDEGGKDLVPIEAIVAGGSSDERSVSMRLFIKVP